MGSDLDLLTSIKILALRSVQKEDSDYVTRRLCRWYSTTFHCSLNEAENLPIEDLLTIWFECKYEDLDKEEREAEAKILCETKEERLAREEAERQAEKADADFLLQATEAAKMLGETSKLLTSLPQVLDKMKYESGATPLKTDASLTSVQSTKTISAPAQMPPDIKVEYVSESELGDLDSWDLLSDPKDPH